MQLVDVVTSRRVQVSYCTIGKHIIICYGGRGKLTQRLFGLLQRGPLTAAVYPCPPSHCGGRAVHGQNSVQRQQGGMLCLEPESRGWRMFSLLNLVLNSKSDPEDGRSWRRPTDGVTRLTRGLWLSWCSGVATLWGQIDFSTPQGPRWWRQEIFQTKWKQWKTFSKWPMKSWWDRNIWVNNWL